jgi:hypothetical protein
MDNTDSGKLKHSSCRMSGHLLRRMDDPVEHRNRKGNHPDKKQKNTSFVSGRECRRKLAIVTRNGELRQRTPASSSLANYCRSGSDRGTQDVRDQVCE